MPSSIRLELRSYLWYAIALNLAAVAALGLIGLAKDEWWLRAIGHAPCFYDYLFWLVLALNGPSGFSADWLAWTSGLREDVRFLAQYGIWFVLLPMQWLAYCGFAGWAAASPTRRRSVYAMAAVLALAGCVLAGYVWFAKQEPVEHFVDVYFWPVRIMGIALSGVWISGLLYRIHSDRASTLPSTGNS